MNTLDIRNPDENQVAEIIFGEDCQVEYDGEFVDIYDMDNDMVNIRFGDIDNLIKALQKAKELWGEQS